MSNFGTIKRMPPTRSFFDPTLMEKWGVAFVREDKVDEALARLIPNARISKGSFSCPGYAEPRDLAWNHMDQNHRPLIHRTYGDAMRMHIGVRAAFSLTRFGNGPLIIPVFDGQFKENGFYQIICLFGLIVVVNVIECHSTTDGTRMDIRWAIASHRFLRFLHPFLDRRLRRLNVVQNQEDEVIRKRRTVLRAAGYRFATDEPDFVNANAMANNVVFPPLAAAHSIAIADFPENEAQRIELGGHAYIVRRVADAIEVWPGVCPHEGAELSSGDLRGAAVKCSWHGLEFGPRRIVPGGAAVSLCGASLIVQNGRLDAVPLQKT